MAKKRRSTKKRTTTSQAQPTVSKTRRRRTVKTRGFTRKRSSGGKVTHHRRRSSGGGKLGIPDGMWLLIGVVIIILLERYLDTLLDKLFGGKLGKLDDGVKALIGALAYSYPVSALPKEAQEGLRASGLILYIIAMFRLINGLIDKIKERGQPAPVI